MRQLLTHTSGIPEYEDEVDWRRDYSERQLAELVGLLRRRSTPGEKFEYSNSSYLLLGIIIGMMTGKLHADYIRENIFEPLGMKTARIVSDADIVPNRVAGYRMSKDRILNQDWVSPTFNQTADGCVRLSLNDLLAWERGVRARALLKPESWSRIFTPVVLKSGKTHSLRICMGDQTEKWPDGTRPRWFVSGFRSHPDAVHRRGTHYHRSR